MSLAACTLAARSSTRLIFTNCILPIGWNDEGELLEMPNLDSR
jgi:hypothetical protein